MSKISDSENVSKVRHGGNKVQIWQFLNWNEKLKCNFLSFAYFFTDLKSVGAPQLRKLYFNISFQFKNCEILTLFLLWRTFEAFPESEILHKVLECTLELSLLLLKISKIFVSDLNSVGLPQLWFLCCEIFKNLL